MPNTCEKNMIASIMLASHKLCTCYDLAVPNCYTQPDNEADLFLIRKSGLCDEIEIKVSRSDLLQDRNKIVKVRPKTTLGFTRHQKKPKYGALADGELTCNYFWYAIREGIGSLEDIPSFAGLIVVKPDGGLKVLRCPTRLHLRKLSFEERYQIARKLHYRYWGVGR